MRVVYLVWKKDILVRVYSNEKAALDIIDEAEKNGITDSHYTKHKVEQRFTRQY